MSEFKLEAKKRDLKIKAKDLLATSRVPATVYGPKTEAFSIDLDYQEFRKTLLKVRKGRVVSLSVDGKEYDVLVKAYDFDPIYDTFRHIDFLAIDPKSPVIAEVTVELSGDSNATRLGGVVRQELDKIKVKCLAKDLPESFRCDLGKLEHFKSIVKVSDIEVPSSVKVLTSDVIVASVIVPRSVASATNVALKADPAQDAPKEEGSVSK